MTPLILIDVDGPLNPWAANPKPANYRPFDIKVGWWRKLRIHLDPDHGWKYPAVARYAYERPLVWFDDDFGLHAARRERFVHKRRHLTTALVHVDPGTGIGAQHLDAARKAFSGNP
ncbi:hypothetical protein [Lentzea sp.]|uniref:hypothetical protein n=1 Tax=Lentzea sp. TaxID=56099 RepID=UPI002CFDF969|nr:hypothetical protein [Lentzea sp.]HUQ57242.1 hypothetical protein [Lentzea sp.]